VVKEYVYFNHMKEIVCEGKGRRGKERQMTRISKKKGRTTRFFLLGLELE